MNKRGTAQLGEARARILEPKTSHHTLQPISYATEFGRGSRQWWSLGADVLVAVLGPGALKKRRTAFVTLAVISNWKKSWGCPKKNTLTKRNPGNCTHLNGVAPASLYIDYGAGICQLPPHGEASLGGSLRKLHTESERESLHNYAQCKENRCQASRLFLGG